MITSFTAPILKPNSGPSARRPPDADSTGNRVQGEQRSIATVAWLFDDLTMEGRRLALRAAQAYLDDNKRRPSHVVGIFDASAGLRQVQRFTADAEVLREALTHVRAVNAVSSGRGTSVSDYNRAQPARGQRPLPTVSADMDAIGVRATTDYLDRNAAGHRTLDAITAVVKGLDAATKGRKALILFAEGLPVTDSTEERLNAVLARANRINVAIYPVDVRGLRTENDLLQIGQELSRVSEDGDGNLRPGGGWCGRCRRDPTSSARRGQRRSWVLGARYRRRTHDRQQ